LIIFDSSEIALYKIENELKNLYDKTKFSCYLGNIQDKGTVDFLMKKYSVDTIYHTAAYKHVPIVEDNIIEAVKNNILGTKILADIAVKNNVKTFVLISSDKAVRPTNYMGATKRFSELLIKAKANDSGKTNFSIVRFGNVMGSSGSVIPLFKRQISQGGPVTVTDKKIVRYFMTIREAVQLVIQAGALSNGGDIFILDMGEPILINDLAKKMIKLSGANLHSELFPDGIKIKYIGLRPGEKLYEELLIDNKCTETDHKLIFRADETSIEFSLLDKQLHDLEQAVSIFDEGKTQKVLQNAIREFKPTRNNIK